MTRILWIIKDDVSGTNGPVNTSLNLKDIARVTLHSFMNLYSKRDLIIDLNDYALYILGNIVQDEQGNPVLIEDNIVHQDIEAFLLEQGYKWEELKHEARK